MADEAPKTIVFNPRDPNTWLLLLILVSNVVAAWRTGQPVTLPPIQVSAAPGAAVQVHGPVAPPQE